MSRWIRTTVDMLDHDVLNVGPYDRRSAWLWLLTHATWKDKRVNHKGRPLELKRGQVIAGRAFLAEKWGWSEQNVRTFMTLLVKSEMIAIPNQSNGHFANVVTICNYDKYQSAKDDSQPDEQPVPNQCLTSVQPVPNQTLTSTTTSTPIESFTPQTVARTREKRGSRLSPDWVLPKSWGVWARTTFPQSTDASVRFEAEKFRDFWHAKPGRSAAKLDWEATWRNWCRTAFSAAKSYGTPSRPDMANVVKFRPMPMSEVQQAHELEQWALNEGLIPAGNA